MAKREIRFIGDIHGQVKTLPDKLFFSEDCEEKIVFLLGDVGLNFWLDDRDCINQSRLQKLGYICYCLTGNHGKPVDELEQYDLYQDSIVNGDVWINLKYPNIRFLQRFGEYEIDGMSILAIDGAYSVDKARRLAMGAPWFEREELSDIEMKACLAICQDKHYTFVLTHTAPVEWEPIDLFLPCTDQSTVSKRMEFFLSTIAHSITWDAWLFGHYHDTRLIRPHVMMLYEDSIDAREVLDLWDKGNWHWMKKDPQYFCEASGQNVDKA